MLSKFNVPKESITLPLFLNYRSIGKPSELLAIPYAVLRIDVITDTDGFRFLNIVTKKWDADLKKRAGKVGLSIK